MSEVRLGELGEFQRLVDCISDWHKAMHESAKDVVEEMNTVVEDSKNYQLLDNEWNWIMGHIAASEHFLSVADDMIKEINEE